MPSFFAKNYQFSLTWYNDALLTVNKGRRLCRMVLHIAIFGYIWDSNLPLRLTAIFQVNLG